jgi:general secretion pathway protein G
MMRERDDAAGFTIVETVIVLLVIALALWMSIPAYESYVKRTRILESVVVMGEMSKGIRQFEMKNGALPDSLDAAGYGGKTDPWGFPFEYVNLRNLKGNGTARKDKKLAPLNSDFDLYSVGPDGLTAASLGNSRSRDDIVRARDGAFIGTAEEFDP